jgi:hypothetical protein
MLTLEVAPELHGYGNILAVVKTPHTFWLIIDVIKTEYPEATHI